MPQAEQFRAGLLYGAIAYFCWGLVPLYFRKVRDVPSVEVLAHRIVWSIALLLGLTLLLGLRQDLKRVLRSARLILTLLASACLLAFNWLLYIYATNTNRVTEAGLGYYMMPLVNALLATLFLGEKLRPAHYLALSFIIVGVATPFLLARDFTWLAIALPVTFGFYALLRKTVAVDSLVGLTIETLLLLPVAGGYLLGIAVQGTSRFGPNLTLNAWLIFSGVVTVVPLLTFSLSVRRLPLLANSLIQFLSPTMQFLVAWYWIEEPIAPERWYAIVAVWIAVGIFMADAIWQARTAKPRPGIDEVPITE